MDESGEEWDGRSLLDYEDGILSALVWNRMPEEAERGLMHWYGKEDNLDAKVRSRCIHGGGAGRCTVGRGRVPSS